MSQRSEQNTDELFGRVLEAGEDVTQIRSLLSEAPFDDLLLTAVLRRAVSARFLDELAKTPPWSQRPRILATIVLSPGCSRGLAQRLVASLYWADLATIATTMRVPSAVRVRAEGLLCDRLPEMRMGERISLAKRATAPVLRTLMADSEAGVAAATLLNPRLREEDLVIAIRHERVAVSLIEAVVASPRWREDYKVRLELVLQRRTPLSVALGQLTALRSSDLRRIIATPGIATIVRMAAERVVRELSGKPDS